MHLYKVLCSISLYPRSPDEVILLITDFSDFGLVVHQVSAVFCDQGLA